MTRKHVYPVITGIITMLVFGLVLGQSVLAVLILLDWPVSRALSLHPVVLSLAVGFVQGVSEQTGRLVAFRTVLREVSEARTSILYGLGHGGVEFVYSVLMAVFGNSVWSAAGMEIVVRWFMLGGQVGLSVLVFAAVRRKGMRYLFPMAILLHATIDAFSVAVDKGYMTATALTTDLVYVGGALVTMGLAFLVYRRLVNDRRQPFA